MNTWFLSSCPALPAIPNTGEWSESGRAAPCKEVRASFERPRWFPSVQRMTAGIVAGPGFFIHLVATYTSPLDDVATERREPLLDLGGSRTPLLLPRGHVA